MIPRLLVVTHKGPERIYPAMRRNGFLIRDDGRLPEPGCALQVVIEKWKKWQPLLFWDYGIVLLRADAHARLQENGYDVAEFRPVEILAVNGHEAPALCAPKYLWAYPAPTVKLRKEFVTIERGIWAGQTRDRFLPEELPAGGENKRAPFCWDRLHPTIVLCEAELVALARREKWNHLYFRPIDLSSYDEPFSVEYTGTSWPPRWWPEGFTPDLRNIRTVSEDAIVAPLGAAPAPKVENRPRQPTPEACLISLADVEKLKLQVEDQGWETVLTAEVPLNRPLYDSDTLDVSVVIEDEDNVPKRSQITEAVQSILKLLERVLPEIEKRIRAQFELGDPAQTEELLASLHSPSLSLAAHELASPIRWSFVVEGDPLAVHVEFERMDIVDVWVGDGT